MEYCHAPEVKIFAFEPLEFAADWIEECLDFCDIENVFLVRKGLFRKEATLDIQVAGSPEVHGAHSTLNMDWFKEENYPRESIQVVRLDDFCKNH